MPQLMIRGMELTDIKRISASLTDELAQVVGCPRDYFTIEAVNTVFVADGSEVKGYPLVQVNWFDRGQEVQDRAAAVIDRHIRQTGYEHIEIYFLTLFEDMYYENGKHF